MKTIEQLRQLANNPFYVMSEEDKRRLDEADKNDSSSDDEQQVSKKKGTYTSKKVRTKGTAAVKETGKLNKHDSDPVKE